MSERIYVVDVGQFEDAVDGPSTKIIRDDGQYLVVKSILASEIVQPYQDRKTGKTIFAYKAADELAKAAWTFRNVPIKALSHPTGNHIEAYEDTNGKVENTIFRKDLMDPKTKRPCRRGIEGELWFYRDQAPEVKDGPFKAISEATAKAIREGLLKDNSIGFSCVNDPSPGEFQGQRYDVVQRQIYGNHLAAPIERGRCPSPYCGIGVGVDSAGLNMIEVQDAEQGVSYRFDKTKFTGEQAMAWADKQKAAKDCPICSKIQELGVLEASKRLISAYGAGDMLIVLQDAKTPAELEAERQARITKNDSSDGSIVANRKALKELDSLIGFFP